MPLKFLIFSSSSPHSVDFVFDERVRETMAVVIRELVKGWHVLFEEMAGKNEFLFKHLID